MKTMEFSEGFPQITIGVEFIGIPRDVQNSAMKLTNELVRLGRKVTFPYQDGDFQHRYGCHNQFLLLEERPRYEKYTFRDSPEETMDGTMWYRYAHCIGCKTRLYIPRGAQEPPEDPEWWKNE